MGCRREGVMGMERGGSDWGMEEEYRMERRVRKERK